MSALLKLRDGQGVDPVIFGMRPDEFDERNVPLEIESDDHAKVASGDFESRTLAIQNFCIRSC